MGAIRRILLIAFLALLILAIGLRRCGAPLAETVPTGLIVAPVNVDATVQARVNARLTALAPTPTLTPAPAAATATPAPACSKAALPTPGASERAFYVCGGEKWMFEGWHFSLGYVRQEGGGCFRVQNGEFLSACQLDHIDRWDNEWQRWEKK